MRREENRKYQGSEQSGEDNDADAEASGSTQADASEGGDGTSEQTELVEGQESAMQAAETAGNTPEQAAQVEDAKTYQIKENSVLYQVQPRVLASGETRWMIVAFIPSVQGPVLQTEQISDEQADDLGLSRATQQKLNALTVQANKEFQLPRSLRGAERSNAPLSELEQALEREA